MNPSLFAGARSVFTPLPETLEGQSHNVVFASDPATAITLLREQTHRLVIVDEALVADQVAEHMAKIVRAAGGAPVMLWVREEMPPADVRSQLNGGVAGYLHSGYPIDDHVTAIESAIQQSLERCRAEMMRSRLIELELSQRLTAEILDSLRHHVRKQDPPTMPGLCIGHASSPLDSLGGDFCGWFSLPDSCIGVYVGDASGHDLTAWVVANFIEQEIDLLYKAEEWRTLSDPSALLDYLNNAVYRGERAYASMVYLVIHQDTGKVFFSSAGQTPFFARTADNHIDLYFSNSPSLGLEPNVYHPQMQICAYDYTHLTLYTDGLGGRRFSTRKTDDGAEVDVETAMLKHLHKFASEDPAAFARFLIRARGRITGGQPRTDDVAVLVVRTGVPYSPCEYNEEKLVCPRPANHASLLGLAIDKIGAEVGYDAANHDCRLVIHGRGELAIGFALAPIVKEAITEGTLSSLVFDCLDVTSMDSTFLGFLHSITALCERANIRFAICLARHDLIKHLLEMRMDKVVAHLVKEPIPWSQPTEPVSRKTKLDRLGICRFSLEMHLTLAQLHPDNEEEFAGVIGGLQKEEKTLVELAERTKQDG